ncbi:MAG TPA: hypothetical protein DCM68_08600 [Verrucomicrobia bacterium]|nr:hypothetical protein [Verrucomicrobiota bacterium]
MKKPLVLLAALLAASPFALAKEAGPAPDPAPLTPFSIGAYLSYWNVEDLDEFDIGGAFGAGVAGRFRLHDFLSLELRLSGYAAGDSEEVFIEGEGWFDNEITVVAMPMEAGVLVCLPVGETVSLYGGGGIGFYLFDAQFRSEQGPWETTYDIELDDEGGWYAILGARAQMARNVAFFVEGKYTWVETALKQSAEFLDGIGIEGIEPDLDFSGVAVNAGMIFTF